MQKTFCDKCEKEMSYESISVECSDKDSIIGRKSVYRQFCPRCKEDFINLLNDFLPNFMNDPIPDKKQEKKRTFFGKNGSRNY